MSCIFVYIVSCQILCYLFLYYFRVSLRLHLVGGTVYVYAVETTLKETRSVTMNIFSKKKCILFKSFVKIELSYIFTINMVSTAKNCKEK